MDENAPSLDVYEHTVQMLEITASIAWSKLGLTPDLNSGKIETNLSQAKLAIDIAAFLAGMVEDRLDSEDRRRVQGLVRDLRINYVQKSKEGL